MTSEIAWDPAIVAAALAAMESRLEVLDEFVTADDPPAVAFDPGWE